MIRKVLKKVAQAAVAQPWEYVGEGAPEEWEFRVSPDEQHLAVYDPNRGRWLILTAGYCVIVAEEDSTTEMNAHTGDWDQYLRLTEPE